MLTDTFSADKIINKANTPFLFELATQFQKKQFYKGLSILHNIPLTFSTILEIKCLQQSGASVVVTPCKITEVNSKVLEALNKNGIELTLNPKEKHQHYDIHLDCCAELYDLPSPIFGTVELTQTGVKRYNSINPNYPIISIDSSILKPLETQGTGIGFVQALQLLTSESINNKKIVLFGYGKVGRGIVSALKKYTNKIIVIENDLNIIATNQDNAIEIIPFNKKSLIKEHLINTFCVVTATGIPDLISENFEKEDFKGSYLANMGALDEFGNKFMLSDVLFEKKPINFSLDYPTPLAYIDPIFFALISSIKILTTKESTQGISAFPESLALGIIRKWKKIYQKDLEH